MDDDAYSIATFDCGEQRDVGEGGDVSELREEAISLQKLTMCRLAHAHTRGRANVSYVDSTAPWTNEKLFRIDPVFDWAGGDPVEIAEALRGGRVRARVNAAMGTGKTTKLAPYLAEACKLRVLLVSLDALCLQQVAVYVEQVGLGRYRRHRSMKKQAHLTCMTYGDFNGIMVGSGRSALFKETDLIIFDEAFVGTADVFVAKRCFAAYAHPTTSLLLASATIRTDSDEKSTVAKGMGSYEVLEQYRAVSAVIASGELMGKYLVDRAAAYVSSDEDAALLQEYYAEQGVDTMCLDEAATFEEIHRVCEWLKGDSTTPRVTVLVGCYGIGYNIPQCFGLVWPTRRVGGVSGGVYGTWDEFESKEMVAQMKSRNGRGLVAGSGGVVFGASRSEAFELYPDQRLAAFVKLVAAGVRPMTNGNWKAQYDLLPNLEQATASYMLKVALPLQLVVRYMAKDGRFAAKYVKALNLFAQPDHFLMPSEHEEPASMVGWITDVMAVGAGGYEHEALIPIEATGEARLAMHVVSAVAGGEFEIERWRPPRAFSYDDGFDSGDEATSPAALGRRLRRVEIAQLAPVDEAPRALEWSYQPTSQAVGDVRRGGRYVDSARFLDAVRALEQTILDYKQPDIIDTVSPVDESPGLSEVPLPTLGTVESPGGSEVCLLPTEVCEKLNRGNVLQPTEMVSVVAAAKPVIVRFAASRLFDALAGPWESVLRTLLLPEVVSQIVKIGEATPTYTLVCELNRRFNAELVGVLKNSNVTRSRFRKLFSRPPKIATVMREVAAGSFGNIAQTQGYFARVTLIKSLLAQALDVAERSNVYLPAQYTESQRMQPVRGAYTHGQVGQGLFYGFQPPPGYAVAVPRSGHMRVPSNTPSLAGSEMGSREWMQARFSR